MDFQQQELLEFSIVPVPANADCLIEARSAGIDVEPLREWAAKTLEQFEPKIHPEAPTFMRAVLDFGACSARIPSPPSSTGFLTNHIGVLESPLLEPAPQPILAKQDHDPADCDQRDCPSQARVIRMLRTAPTRIAPCRKSLRAKGMSPPSPSGYGMAEESVAWSAPALGDFTDAQWGDLDDAEKRRVARHFAWVAAMPPASFGDMKLPHHRASDGDVVWGGVRAAMGTLMGGRARIFPRKIGMPCIDISPRTTESGIRKRPSCARMRRMRSRRCLSPLRCCHGKLVTRHLMSPCSRGFTSAT